MPERVVLVTGAARGIGAATVRALAARGDHVIALDSCGGDAATGAAGATPEDLDEVVEGNGGAEQVFGVVADVRDRAALATAVDDTLTRWGRLDAVVAGAAVIAGGSPLWDTDPRVLDELWDVDVRGIWNTAAIAVPAMLAGPDPSGCRFVGIASAAGTHGLHRLAAYSTVKHAVVGLVKGLAADLVGTGVTAVAVSPGSTRTPMLDATARLYGLDAPDVFAENQLVHRLLEPAEVAATIAFCCSTEGGVLNGSVVHADGGFSP